MFLSCPFTKIATMIPLRKTNWPPELKVEKPLNIFSQTYDRIPKKSQKCSSYEFYKNC